MGFQPLQVVPSILVSELITGLLAAGLHHYFGNVNLKPKTLKPKKIFIALKNLGFKKSFAQGIPDHLKVSLLIAACSVIGSIAAVFVAISLPQFYLKLYIGLLIFIIGIVILITLNKNYGFSWKKITGLSLIASFNKGISGGGYGPVITGGQLLAGVNEKNAIGITSLAEGLTCGVAILVYLLTKNIIDWSLAPYLIIGAVLSAPLSAYTLQKIKKPKNLRRTIGLATIILGLITLIKLFA
jgi:hypothetical protein